MDHRDKLEGLYILRPSTQSAGLHGEGGIEQVALSIHVCANGIACPSADNGRAQQPPHGLPIRPPRHCAVDLDVGDVRHRNNVVLHRYRMIRARHHKGHPRRVAAGVVTGPTGVIHRAIRPLLIGGAGAGPRLRLGVIVPVRWCGGRRPVCHRLGGGERDGLDLLDGREAALQDHVILVVVVLDVRRAIDALLEARVGEAKNGDGAVAADLVALA